MKDEMNSRLIKAIRDVIPVNVNLAAYLMDLLSLGREAVYRRIRGDVSFDLNELALIAKELNISIDNIIGKESSQALFSIDMIKSEKFMDQYYDFLVYYINVFSKMKMYPDSQVIAANNQLPFSFFLPYEKLSRFYLYKWMYQVQTSRASIPFANFQLPQKVIEANKRYSFESRYACHTTSILSQNTFSSFLNTISFFEKLDLLTEEDLSQMKEEVMELLNKLESMAISGQWANDYEFNFYVSNIDFDASYTYMSCPEFELSTIRAFSINVVRSSMPEVCKAHKEWIESLKRYSTLVSRSGDMYRTEFFNKQRNLINSSL